MFLIMYNHFSVKYYFTLNNKYTDKHTYLEIINMCTLVKKLYMNIKNIKRINIKCIIKVVFCSG